MDKALDLEGLSSVHYTHQGIPQARYASPYPAKISAFPVTPFFETASGELTYGVAIQN